LTNPYAGSVEGAEQLTPLLILMIEFAFIQSELRIRLFEVLAAWCGALVEYYDAHAALGCAERGLEARRSGADDEDLTVDGLILERHCRRIAEATHRWILLDLHPVGNFCHTAEAAWLAIDR
jgi:hypothetical protein